MNLIANLSPINMLVGFESGEEVRLL